MLNVIKTLRRGTFSFDIQKFLSYIFFNSRYLAEEKTAN